MKRLFVGGILILFLAGCLSVSDNLHSDNNIKVDKYNLQDEESNLKSKKLIFASLKKSKSFGYSYRLLADYQQLLKNEINANKIEIAEDVSQQKENAGQIRVIR